MQRLCTIYTFIVVFSHAHIAPNFLLRILHYPSFTTTMHYRLNGVPSHFTYNVSSPNSLISELTARNLGVLTTSIHRRCTVTVSVPTISSSFTSTVDFIIVDNLQSDAKLGMDWVGTCRAMAGEGLVQFPLSSVEGKPRAFTMQCVYSPILVQSYLIFFNLRSLCLFNRTPLFF